MGDILEMKLGLTTVCLTKKLDQAISLNNAQNLV